MTGLCDPRPIDGRRTGLLNLKDSTGSGRRLGPYFHRGRSGLWFGSPVEHEQVAGDRGDWDLAVDLAIEVQDGDAGRGQRVLVLLAITTVHRDGQPLPIGRPADMARHVRSITRENSTPIRSIEAHHPKA